MMQSETIRARPIAAGLWAEDPAPRLIGGRDRATGRIVFPMPTGGEAERFDAIPLSREGTIWSWTVQRFPPKSPPYAGPAAFEPFAMGYVELADEVIVETRLTGFAFDELACGLPVRLEIVPFAAAEDGGTLTTYAFGPAA